MCAGILAKAGTFAEGFTFPSTTIQPSYQKYTVGLFDQSGNEILFSRQNLSISEGSSETRWDVQWSSLQNVHGFGIFVDGSLFYRDLLQVSRILHHGDKFVLHISGTTKLI